MECPKTDRESAMDARTKGWRTTMDFGKSIVVAAFAIGASTAIASTAHSTPVFDPSSSTCTTVNCSSETISGTFGALGAPESALPWTVEIFAFAQRCLRVEITSQTRDLEIVVVAPNGTIFRNDDSGLGPCPNCPLVKVGNTPNQGWYTVQVAQFTGGSNFSNFTLRHGLYPVNNANCATPTTPQRSRALTTQKSLDPEFFDEFDFEAAPPSE
jgi:hypothetical protein